MQKPAENVMLNAAEGEAMIARLAGYAPSRSDCEVLIQVVRWYFWLVWTVQEAKLSLKKLRTLLGGQGPKPPTRCEPPASSVAASSRGDGEVSGDGSARDAEVGWSTEAESTPVSRQQRRRPARPEAAIGQAPAASERMPIRGPSASNAAMRNLRQASAAPCVGRAPSMRCPPGWRCASTAKPCSVPYATS